MLEVVGYDSILYAIHIYEGTIIKVFNALARFIAIWKRRSIYIIT
jgi:hypothetical protein